MFVLFEFPAIFFPVGVNRAILMVVAKGVQDCRKRAPTARAATIYHGCCSTRSVAENYF